MNLLIVDDEPLARAEIGRLCSELFPDFRGTETANLTQARAALLREEFDAVFVDLDLAGTSGLDLLPDAETSGVPAIVVTAHDHLALDAYYGVAVDYLIKPIDPGRLFRSLAKISKGRARLSREWVLLSDHANCWPVQPAQLLMAEAEGSYTVIRLSGRRPLTICRPLKDIEKMLEPHDFIRANRGQLVNLRKVLVIQRQPNGRMLAQLEDHGEIEFSRRQAQAFRGRFAV